MGLKRVLLITSDFPPLVGTNTQRVQSFVRHLPSVGWQPTVVTQAIEDLEQIDSTEAKALSHDLDLLRVQSPDPFAVRRRRLGCGPVDTALMTASVHGGDPIGEAKETESTSSLSRFFRDLASNGLKWAMRWFVYHPDAFRPWANAVARTIRLKGWDRNHQIVVTSSPSYSSHVAGLQLKRATAMPWIADFRDLWVGRPYRSMHSRWHESIDRRLEAQVVAHCDRLVIASPAWKEIFIERYGQKIASKIVCITNGFEGKLFERIRSECPSRLSGRKFVLTGSMHEAESPLPFLKALSVLNQAHPELLEEFEAVFIGNAGEHLSILEQAAQNTGLGERIRFLPPRAHESCVRTQMEADFLVMFSAFGHENTIRGKSFEYMATGKPIIACIPPTGVQADLLKQAGTAVIVPYGDIPATVDALNNLLSGRAGHLRPNWPWIRQFDRANLACQLAELFEEVTQNNSSLVAS